MKVAELVFEKISPLFNSNIKLVDVEYVKKADGMHLIVYIDKVGGITIKDCVEVNHLLEEPLEELNPTKDASYNLDVSSYGLDKPLKFLWQFEKYYNQTVDVKLYHKVGDLKEFTAKLIFANQDEIEVLIDDKNYTFKRSDVAFVLPHIEF